MKFQDIKDLQYSIKFSIVFLISLLICYGVPTLVEGTIVLLVNISEISAVGSFTIGFSLVLEIILMGPVFIIIYYIIMKHFLSKINQNEGNNKRNVFIIEIISITLITIFAMGHAIHVFFNHANALYRIAYGTYDTTALFSFLYVSDEWLGHHLIHIALFGFMILALLTEFLMENHERMNKGELIISGVLGVGLFFMSGYASYEGQSAFLMFVLAIILLTVEIIIILKKKVKILNHPILLATIICSVIIIGFFIYWIIAFGWKPYFPFHFQPSEL